MRLDRDNRFVAIPIAESDAVRSTEAIITEMHIFRPLRLWSRAGDRRDGPRAATLARQPIRSARDTMIPSGPRT